MTTALRASRIAVLGIAGAGLVVTVVLGALAISWGNPAGLVFFVAPYVLLGSVRWLRASVAVPKLTRIAALELLAATGWIAVGLTWLGIVMRFPFRSPGSNAHGAGVHGGVTNALLFPWLHLLLYALALRLAARFFRAGLRPRAASRR